MDDGPRVQSPQGAQNSLSRRDVEIALRLEAGRSDIALRRRVAHVWISLFTLNVVGVMVAIFLVGFGLMTLSTTVILSLITETLAHAGAMVYTVTRYLFPARGG